MWSSERSWQKRGAVASIEGPKTVAVRASSVAASPPARRIRLARLYPYLLVTPTLLFLASVFLYPVAYSLYLSTRQMQLFEFATGGRFAGVSNYVAATRDPLVWNALTRTGSARYTQRMPYTG